MKVTYLNVSGATYANIKHDGGSMSLKVQDMRAQSLLDLAKEMREDAQKRLRRADLIEQAALSLDDPEAKVTPTGRLLRAGMRTSWE